MDTNAQKGATKRTLSWSMLGALLALIALVLLAAAICRPALRERNRANCAGLHMAQILFACAEYRATNGSLPPALVSDKDGRPMHSWRVLILPYLGYANLYDRYHFDEPWDGPHNRLLAQEMPHEYRCPACAGRSDVTTNYLAVVGPTTPWPGGRAVRNQEIEGNEATTVLFVEVADSDINWMSPCDMAFEHAIMGVNVDRCAGISSHHPGGANVGFIDGFINFLHDDVVSEDLRRMLTLGGGKKQEHGVRGGTEDSR